MMYNVHHEPLHQLHVYATTCMSYKVYIHCTCITRKDTCICMRGYSGYTYYMYMYFLS